MIGNIIGNYEFEVSNLIENMLDFSEWLQQLSTRACNHFATGAVLGQLLNESWLICRAGEYLWNYTRHLFYSNRLRLILDPLSTIVNALKKIGHERLDSIFIENDKNNFGFVEKFFFW
jgi:hypothetical protein